MPTIELINDTIESLDFEHEQPCENSQHQTHHADEPAKYLIHAGCPDCGNAVDYFICESGWKRGYAGVRCNLTGRMYSRSEIWTILREVR